MTSEFNKSSNTLILFALIGLAAGLPQIFLSTFTIFVKPLIGEFGWTRGQVSLLFSIITLTIAVAAPIFSRLIQRFGVRSILVISIVLLAATIIAMSLTVAGYTSFVLWMIIIGFIGTGTTTFVYLGVFPSWFTKRLGIALGIAAAGIGLGQTIFPILAQYFISGFGWRSAYQFLALISIVFALPGAVLIIRYKSGGQTETVQETASQPMQVSEIVTNARFWYLTAGFFIIPMIAAGCTIHAMPIFLDRGIEAGRAASIVALGGLALIIARVVAGFLLDWFGAKPVAILACLVAALAPIALISSAPLALVAIAPLFYGLALGIEGDLMPFGIRNVFGADRVTALYGLFFAIFNLGVVTGPLLMGITFDATGSYDAALIALSVSGLIAIPAFVIGLKEEK